jgi:heptosyltransferase-3
MNTSLKGEYPKSILVIYVSRIGDTMLITPAVRSIARHWPGARIDFIGSPTSAEVFRHLPFVSNVSSKKKKWIHFQGWTQPKAYDLAFVYGYAGDGPFVDYAFRIAQHVIAFKQDKGSLNAKLFAAVERPPFQTCHSVDHFLSLIKPLNIPVAGKYLSYVIAEDEQEWSGAEVGPLRKGGAGPLIGLQIASFPTKGYRDWPLGNFIELCRRIRNAHPFSHFLIFGGSLERDRTEALHAALADCSTHYASRLSLRQTAALMGELDLYVGVDTGPTHIMGALHRPMVAMYHGSSPSCYLAPLDHPKLWVVDDPRTDRGGSPDDYHMSDISVDVVFAKVQEALTP